MLYICTQAVNQLEFIGNSWFCATLAKWEYMAQYQFSPQVWHCKRRCIRGAFTFPGLIRQPGRPGVDPPHSSYPLPTPKPIPPNHPFSFVSPFGLSSNICLFHNLFPSSNILIPKLNHHLQPPSLWNFWSFSFIFTKKLYVFFEIRYWLLYNFLL